MSLPDAIIARLDAFSSYENDLLDHIQQRVSVKAPQASAASLQGGSSRPQPLILSVKPFEEKEGENIMLKICEVEIVMAREWALTSESSVDCAFPTWDELKKTLSVVFLSPNHIYHVRSRFLPCRQKKKNLFCPSATYTHHRHVCRPLPEAVTTTVFMDGLRTRVAHTEVFR
ncbi:Gag Polyprotein [Phytophthora megakarya]|uniref:Gag Polyprotein n=1 Tax=Phytophthora megakarya TaxID=4795 RepID=A0A225VWR5_9STRA|nr:Gag Polyprotein [Phytophthora megakarya]